MSSLRTDISAVLDQLCACWNATRLRPILDLWDPAEDEPYALPQECIRPLLGWKALGDYLQQGEARLHRASMRYWDLQAKLLAPEVAIAIYQMHWNGHVKGFEWPMGIDSRVTAAFRRRGERWRICHYVEAPPAPLLHLQQRYAAAVDPEFRLAEDTDNRP